VKKYLLLLFSSLIITLFAAYYQRITGPSYSVKKVIEINKNSYIIELPRSNEGKLFAEIILKIPDKDINGKVFFRNYLSGKPFIPMSFERKMQNMVARLPHLEAGEKFEYYIELKYENITFCINSENPIIIRYRDYVPAIIMIPHIILMFLALMFSNLTGLSYFYSNINIKTNSIITFILLFTGGILYGCIVQKFAFGKYWTGIPFGWDLTDNKTLIAVIFWVTAIFFNRKKERPFLFLLASLVMIFIFTIPHSMFGTEKLTNN
jgi:hypothetical protein